MKRFHIQTEREKPRYEFIPYDFIKQYEEQAKHNHSGQDIERLNERMGLSWKECLAVVRGIDFDKLPESMNEVTAKYHVLCKVNEWILRQQDIHNPR